MFSNPLKEWFYFTRGQRQGIVVLIFLVLITPLASRIARMTMTSPVCTQSALADLKTIQQQLQKAKTGRRDSPSSQQEFRLTDPVLFKPDTLSVEGWIKMGVPVRLAESINNYQLAGGSFIYREDLRRLYLMEDEIYRQLEEYIDLPSREKVSGSTHVQYTAEEVNTYEPVMININTADSIELQAVRGIGPVFGSRISRYRELLGGFHSLYQLLEVYGIDSVRFEQIIPQVYTDRDNIRMICINSVTASELARHPYIDRNVAMAIIALREQHGPFEEESDIKLSHLVDEQLLERISPYINFD